MLIIHSQGRFFLLGLLVASLIVDLSHSFIVTSFSKSYDHLIRKTSVPTIQPLGQRSNSFSNSPTIISLSSSSSSSSSQGSQQNKQPRKQQRQPPKGKGYQQIGAPINPNICTLTKTEILQHLKERTKARRSQNFQKADEILSRLKRDNVFVNDATKQWRADGRSFIDFSSPGANTAGTNDNNHRQMYVEYTKARNSKSLSIRDEEYILTKLKERHDAKRNRDYDTADDILDELRFLKNVQVDDTKRTYRIVDPFKVEYTFGGKRVNNIHPDILHAIESKIKERANAKKKKEYDVADDILKELTEIHDVRVDDVKKEWHFMRKKGSSDDVDGGNSKSTLKDNKKKKGREERSSRQYGGNRIEASISDWSLAEDEPENNDNNVIMPEGISLVDDGPNDDDEKSIPIPEGIVFSDEEPAVQSSGEHDDSSSQTSNTDDTIAELESLTVPILKEKLREAGLPVSGRKIELIERLMGNKR